MASNTKIKIFQAYSHLITVKNIDKVTVKDVVEQCGITRQTFYYHFQDLLDVIEWGLRRGAEKALQQGLTSDSLEDALYTFLYQAELHRVFGKKILSSQKKLVICDIILQSAYKLLSTMVRGGKIRPALPDEKLDFALHFYSYAISGSVYDIIMNSSADAHEVTHQILTLLEPLYSAKEDSLQTL